MSDGATQKSAAPLAPGLVRQLGFFTVLCIGVNNIVGSGIYGKPGRLAHLLGASSWTAFALCAALLLFVASSYASMAARHDETGGPYIYAKRSFGPWIGLLVGWTAWISMWAAAGGVTTLLPKYLAVFVPGADGPIAARAIALGLIALLAWINCRGVKPAAGVSTFLTIAKIAPLLLFVAIGLFHVKWSGVTVQPPVDTPKGRGAFGLALFAAFFPLQGFEVVPVPAGELKNPRRDVPLAVTGSLVLTAVLYCLIQIVVTSTCPNTLNDVVTVEENGRSVERIVGSALDPVPGHFTVDLSSQSGDRDIDPIALVKAAKERPLAEAAATFLGEPGRLLMAAGAVISMLGFAAVTILCAPRFLVALGADRLLPAIFARIDPARGTPIFAVLFTCLPAALGCFLADFEALTNLSNIAVLVQYAVTCLAVMTRPGRATFARFVVPFLGLFACCVLAWLIRLDDSPKLELLAFALWSLPAFLLAAWVRRRPAISDPGSSPR